MAKGYLSLKGFKDLYETVGSVDVNISDFVNLEELVLCFDDLERINDEFKLDVLLGFINNLVENGNCKVLIIANEDKIDHNKYSALKEKVIGNSFEFLLDIDSTYDSILNETFSGFLSYSSFLKAHKNFILDSFKKKSKNLRILIFILTYFQKIHSKIDDIFIQESNLIEYKNEIINSLLLFTISISISFKHGFISFKSKNNLETGTDTTFRTFFKNIVDGGTIGKSKDDNEFNFYKDFVETFYKSRRYHYYESIYGYITGGFVFNYERLIEELKIEYHVSEKVIQEHYKILNRLNYPNCYSLNQQDYVSLTKKMLSHSDLGAYELPEYLTIFHYAVRFKNPLNFKIENLKNKIIRGINKGIYHYSQSPFLEHTLRIEDGDLYKTEKNEIKNFIIEVNKQIIEKKKKIELSVLESKFYDDLFIFQLDSLEMPTIYAAEPFFKYFNPNKFYQFFNNLDNHNRYQTILFFQTRYQNVMHHNFDEELSFFQKLSNRISKKNQTLKGKNLNGEIYNWFDGQLKEIVSKLTKF